MKKSLLNKSVSATNYGLQLRSSALVIFAIAASIFLNPMESHAAYCGGVSSTTGITPAAGWQTTGNYTSGRRAFSFTATAGCVYEFTTCGYSTIDTYLRLYSGLGGTLLVNADDQCGLQSRITWTAPSTGTYSILLARYYCNTLNGSGSRLAYRQVSCPNPCPDFSYTAPFTHSSTTAGAVNDVPLRPSTDRTYAITIPCAGSYTFSLCGGASWDTYLYLGTSCGSGNITSNDDACGVQSQIVRTLAAGTVYLTVEGYGSGSAGSYTLSVTGGLANDLCTGATTMAIGGSVAGNTCCGSVDNYPTCGTTNGTAGGVWYRFTGNGRKARASTCGGTTNYDSKIRIYRGSCAAPICVAGNDDACGQQSQVDFCTTNGTTYWALIHGFGSSCGNYTFSLTDLGTPAAVSVTGGGTQCGGTRILNASGGAPGTIYWQGTLSNGTSTATASTSQTVSSSGTYYFRAYDGCNWGPQGSATVTINAVPAGVSVSGGGAFCGSRTITASGGAGGTIYFQGNTSNGTSTGTPSTSQSVTSSGTYYFRSRSGAGCWGTQGSTTVTITPTPTAYAGVDRAQCGNAAYTINTATAGGTYSGVSWAIVAGSGANLTNTTTLTPTITPTTATGSVTVRLTVAGSGGCSGTNPTNDMVMTWTNGPTANAGSNVNQCGGANVLFSGASASTPSTWTWTLLGGGSGSGALINGGATITNWGFNPSTASGSRTIRLTVNGTGTCTGTTQTDDIVVTWIAPPGISAVSPLNSCTGLAPFTITGITGTGSIGSYTWDAPSVTSGSGSITSGGTTSAPTFTPTSASGEFSYTVHANGNSFCTSISAATSITIKWATPPSITSVGAPIVTCGMDPHTMTGAAVTGTYSSVSWSGNANGSWTTSDPVNPSLWVFTPTTQSGSFTSTLTATGSGVCAGTNPFATRLISWSAPPTVNAGTDISVCTGMTAIPMAGASGTGYNTYNWTETLTGSGGWNQGGSITAAAFTPSVASGSVTATVIVTAVGGTCNGRTATDDREIVWFTPPVISAVTTTDVTDCNVPNGYINVSASGVAPVQYSADNGSTYFVDNNFYSLAAGNYTIVVLDATGCSTTYTSNPAVINAPPPVLASSVTVTANNICAGGIDGEITITGVSGGAGGPFTYALDGLGSSRIFDLTSDPLIIDSLAAGNYDIVVMDKFGCESVIYPVVITEPSPISINSLTIVDVVGCGSSGTGSITASATGGTGTLSYWLDSIQNSPVTSGSWLGLPGGSYEVMVSDANLCNTVAQAQINAPWTVTAGKDVYKCGTGNTSLYGEIIGALPTDCTPTCSSGCGHPSGYCGSTNTNTSDDWISRVQFNAINQNSGSSTYSNYTGVSTTVNRGSAYTLTVTVSKNAGWNQYIRAYFDWNRDGDFADAGEYYNLGNSTANPQTGSLSITIPAGASLGNTRMRIIERYAGYSPTNGCGNVTYQEAEDYNINIVAPYVACSPTFTWSPSGGTALTGTVNPASTTVYTLTVNDGSGCIQNDQTTVTVSNETTTTSQTNVDCFSNSNGCVTLNPSNGVQPYLLFGPSNAVQVYGGSMREITVNNTSGTAYTNHPVRITVPFSAGMRADFGNLRFYDSNQSKLQYWIESYTLSTSTVVWVKIPTLSTGNSTLYMTFGDVSVTSEARGVNVFEFFDDFNSYDPTKWTIGTVAATAGTPWSFYGGKLVGGNTRRTLTSVATFTGGKIGETLSYESAVNTSGFSVLSFWISGTNNASLMPYRGSGANINRMYLRDDGAWAQFGNNSPGYMLNQWVRSVIRHTGANEVANNFRAQRFNSAGTLVWDYFRQNGAIAGERLRLGNRPDGNTANQNFNVQWDWMFVRPYISVDPTITFGPVVTSDNQFCGYAAGTYNFNVVDVAGCNNAVSVTITEPTTALSISSLTMTAVGCYTTNDGTIDITVAGGTPVSPPPAYYYNWAGPSGFSSTSEDLTNLIVGAYNVTVADDNACTTNSSIIVTQLAPINAGFYTWKGSTNTLWQIESNWDCRVPDATSRVLIPGIPVGGNDPEIRVGIIGDVFDINIQGTTSNLLDIQPGGLLRIHKP